MVDARQQMMKKRHLLKRQEREKEGWKVHEKRIILSHIQSNAALNIFFTIGYSGCSGM